MTRLASRTPRQQFARAFRATVNTLLWVLFATLGSAGAVQAQVTSDDFSGPALDTNVWTFVDPMLGGPTPSATSTGSHIDITAPDTDFHDINQFGNSVPRIEQQAIGDVDFTIEAKFESELNATSYVSQGIVIEQSPSVFIVVQVFDTGGAGPVVFVANYTCTTGSSACKTDRGQRSDLTVTAPMFLNVERTGDSIVVEYRDEGLNTIPVEIANFTLGSTLTVESVGIFAGSSTTESHTARADYFFETASPIVPEDGDQTTLDVTLAGPGNNSVTQDPDLLTYTLGSSVTLTPINEVGVSIFDAWSGDLTGSAVPEMLLMDGPKSVTATFVAGLCGDGVAAGVEECDEGAANGTAASCCSITCEFVAAATECRASAGICDVAETCTGDSGVCPDDGFAPITTSCRDAAGECDAEDFCDGAGACSIDAKLSTECRAANGVCDAAETCDGVTNDCPIDEFEPVTTVCRASAGDCDAVDFCDGSGACSLDLKLTSECRASTGICDVSETCDGVANDCPTDEFEPVTTSCRDAAGDCDAEDFCDGSGACSIDAKLTTECRAGADVCDLAETCDGESNDCPADEVEPDTTVCRASAGDCDAADFCDGVGVACTADLKLTTECRAAAGDCDVAEACDGESDLCPTDGFEPAATVCSTGVECLVNEACDGNGSCTGGEMAAVDTPCTTGDECLMDEVCDAGGSCVGGRLSVPAPLTCDVTDSLIFFDDVAQDVVVDGIFAYVAAQGAGLRIVDHSNPDLPVEVGFYDPDDCMDGMNPVPFVAEDIAVSDPFLFVSAGPCGVLAFDSGSPLDISNSTVPIAIDTMGDAFGVRRAGDFAYVADFDGGLAVLDLMTGMQVDDFGGGTTVNGAVDVELDGIRSFLATNEGLRLVDDDPTTGLELTGSYDSGGEVAEDAEFVRDTSADLVYLARGLDGIDVLDVTDPSTIQLLDNLPSVAGSYEVSLSGQRGVTAEAGDGIGVLDITNLGSPISLGLFPSEGSTTDVEMAEEFAFATFETTGGGQGGLRIVQLERVGVDPMLIPEPTALLGGLAALTASVAVAWRRRKEQD